MSEGETIILKEGREKGFHTEIKTPDFRLFNLTLTVIMAIWLRALRTLGLPRQLQVKLCQQ